MKEVWFIGPKIFVEPLRGWILGRGYINDTMRLSP